MNIEHIDYEIINSKEGVSWEEEDTKWVSREKVEKGSRK